MDNPVEEIEDDNSACKESIEYLKLKLESAKFLLTVAALLSALIGYMLEKKLLEEYHIIRVLVIMAVGVAIYIVAITAVRDFIEFREGAEDVNR